MARFKLIVAGVIACLLLVLVLQNTASVELKVLFFRATLPKAVLLFATFVAGFVTGLLVAGRVQRSKRRTSPGPEPTAPRG